MLTEAAITIVSAPAPARNARSQTDHEVEPLPGEDLGDARRPSAIAEDDTLWPRYPSKRAEFLFFRPQQNGEWMTIQGQQNGLPVAGGHKTSLKPGATWPGRLSAGRWASRLGWDTVGEFGSTIGESRKTLSQGPHLGQAPAYRPPPGIRQQYQSGSGEVAMLPCYPTIPRP
jgi:hypothetical protein